MEKRIEKPFLSTQEELVLWQQCESRPWNGGEGSGGRLFQRGHLIRDSEDEQNFTVQKNKNIWKSVNNHLENEIAMWEWDQHGSNMVLPERRVPPLAGE